MTALRHLLSHIVDYAGLFPPASLPLPSVIKNYEKYVPGDFQWMLARLIIPAQQLDEFSETFQQLFPEGLDQPPWKISALIPPADDDQFDAVLEQIKAFNDTTEFAQVDTVEGKLPRADLIARTLDRLPPSLSAFLEISWEDPDDLISQLAESERKHTYTKIRSGGVGVDLIPSAERVANFIVRCAEVDLGFKATAGLHHPLRGNFPMTYQIDSATAMMHGFINVFVAACMARCREWDRDQIVSLLQNGESESFTISEDAIHYEGVSVSTDEIQAVREDFAISFGSCSFVEPIEDLIELGWLADPAKTV